MQDLIRAGKAAAGTPLSYASVGAGTSSHLTSELFAQRAGLKLNHVPYGSISTSLVDITSGNVDFGFANLPPTLPLLRTGKLRALGISSAYRSRHLPDVPTVQEQGVADFDVSSWMGIYGQAEMPSIAGERTRPGHHRGPSVAGPPGEAEYGRLRANTLAGGGVRRAQPAAN